MECKEFVLEEYLERIVNNTYLTELVQEYNNNQTKENFVNLCEVLSYRDLFLGMYMVILDKKLQKKIQNGYQVDHNELNDDTCIKDFVKYEISSDSGNHKFLGVKNGSRTSKLVCNSHVFGLRSDGERLT